MVVVFRRKNNGHPRRLLDGKNYLVVDIVNDDIILEVGRDRYKVNKTYLISVESARDILISEFLKED